MPDWNGIIERIYEACNPKDQKSLADMLGVFPSVVSRWRSGKTGKGYPSIEVLTKVSELKGVTLDWLLEGREPKYRPSTTTPPSVAGPTTVDQSTNGATVAVTKVKAPANDSKLPMDPLVEP